MQTLPTETVPYLLTITGEDLVNLEEENSLMHETQKMKSKINSRSRCLPHCTHISFPLEVHG